MVIQNLHILNRTFIANMLLTLLADKIYFVTKMKSYLSVLGPFSLKNFTDFSLRIYIQRSDEFFHVHRDVLVSYQLIISRVVLYYRSQFGPGLRRTSDPDFVDPDPDA
jgi:hypothetical protein